MKQEIERIKIAQAEKMEFERLQLERTKIEAEEELKTHEIEIQAKAISTSHKNIPSIKLPKLDLTRFDRNILKWQEFWGSFDTTTHKNLSLQDMDKLNYLRGLLKSKVERCHFWAGNHWK